MIKQFLKDALGWGFLLWLLGYGLGMVLFAIVPANKIGLILMPIGTVLTLWVAFKKVTAKTFRYYLGLSVIWTLVAVGCDYFLLVIPFKLLDSYYQLDIYLYYSLTFLLPAIIGWRKQQNSKLSTVID